MYPVMGNPYGKTLYIRDLWVSYPQESLEKYNKYHRYPVRGTPNCPLIEGIFQSHMLHGTGIFTIH